MKTIIGTVFVLCTVVSLHAQITITADDYSNVIENGTNTFQATDAGGQRFDLGTIGATDNVYDFTQFTFKSSPRENRYVSPVGTVLENEYPGATFAKVEKSSGIYTYYEMQQDGFYVLGSAMYLNNDVQYYHARPIRPVYKFPIAMGTAWEYTGGSNFIDPYVGITSTLEEQVEVVAAGTLITPGGEGPCLVLRRFLREQMYGPGTANEYETVAYVFLGKDGRSAFVGIATEDFDIDNPRVVYMSYTERATPNAVNTPLVQGCRLGEVYPNPVPLFMNAEVTWTAVQRTALSIALYDVRGVKVATVFEGQCNPGSHNASLNTQELPQGIYFLRMTTPEGVQSSKVLKLE